MRQRPWRAVLRASLGGLLVALTLAGTAVAQYRSEALDATFPVELAGYRLRNVTEYPDKRLGVALNYWRGPVNATVYVYDGGERGIADGTEHPFTRGMFEQAKSDIMTLRSNSEGGSPPRLVRDGVATLREGTPAAMPILVAAYDLRLPRAYSSLLMLTARKGNLIKLRISLPADAPKDDVASVRQFTEGVADVVYGS